MFGEIIELVDLAHKDKMDKAVAVAAELARTRGSNITVVGAGAETPGPVAHTPEKHKSKLQN